MTITITAEAGAKKLYGIMVSPGLGVAWNGDLKRQMSVLFTGRVSNIPWLPPGWLNAVQDLQARYPDDLVRIAPSMGSIHPNPDMPDWILNSQDRMDAWMAIYKASNDAIVSYAAGQQAAGKAQLAALYASAAFWDGAYNLAVNIRDAAPNAAGFVVSSLWNGLGWKWKLALGVGGAAAVVWYWPKLAKLAKSATKALKA
jgi:hypothetical protein